MNQFEPGDVVEVQNYGKCNGTILTIISVIYDANHHVNNAYQVDKPLDGDSSSIWTMSEDLAHKYWKLINKTTMLQPLTDLSNLIQRTFNDDTKVLYRAGYLSKDLNITQKLTDALGEMFVGHIIDGTISSATLQTFAIELIERANQEIAEAEKKESK